MSRKQIHIYSTVKDTTVLLRDASTVKQLRVYQTGVFETRFPSEITEYNQIKSGEGYLIIGFEGSVKMEPFTLVRGGGRRYSLDQLLNPQSVILRTSRFFKCRKEPFEERLLPGSMGTISDDPASLDLYSLFAKIIRKRFEKIQEFYVGPEAAAALDSGIRLSATDGSPPSNDLIRLVPKKPTKITQGEKIKFRDTPRRK